MAHWTIILAQATHEAETGCIKASFDKAFNALELCYGIAADAKKKDGDPDQQAATAFRQLWKSEKITREEFEMADHLRQARNVVTHKFGFETTKEQALHSISIVRRLCSRFAGKVADVMVREVITAKVQDHLAEYVQQMRDHGFSQFPVVNDQGVCIGTLDEKTVFDALLRGKTGLPNCRVKEVMTRHLLPVIDESVTIEEARCRMVADDLTAFLVLDECRGVKGIVTKFELIK